MDGLPAFSKSKRRNPKVNREHDYIKDLLEQEIEQYRMRSMRAFGIHYEIYRTEDAKPILALNGKRIGFNAYAFNVFHKNDPPRAMRVCLNPRGEVRILYHHRWRSVTAYFKHVKPQMDFNAIREGLEDEARNLRWQEQSRWWHANGKKFELLKLPAEIREVVYSYIFGPCIEPYRNHRARKLARSTTVMREPKSSILLTCKLVHREASNMLFKHTPFLVEHIGVMAKLTSNLHQSKMIRRLELALSHDDFVCLFKMNDTGPVYNPLVRTLRRMDLDRLTLSIAAPSMTTVSGVFDGACQQKALSRILNLGWTALRGHRVRLEGFVKTNQRIEFETMFRKERNRFLIWQKQRAATGMEQGYLSQ